MEKVLVNKEKFGGSIPSNFKIDYKPNEDSVVLVQEQTNTSIKKDFKMSKYKVIYIVN